MVCRSDDYFVSTSGAGCRSTGISAKRRATCLLDFPHQADANTPISRPGDTPDRRRVQVGLERQANLKPNFKIQHGTDAYCGQVNELTSRLIWADP